MSNKNEAQTVAFEMMIAELLRAKKFDAVIKAYESRLHTSDTTSDSGRKACFVDSLISKLLSCGKIESAIEVYKQQLNDPSFLNAFTRKAFFNRSREALVPFLMERADEIDFSIAPIILRNMITLAEMSGSLSRISEGLLKFERLFSDPEKFFSKSWPDDVYVNAIGAALGLFRTDIAGSLIPHIQDEQKRAKQHWVIINYERACNAVEIDPTQLCSSSIAMMKDKRIIIDSPTVVVRVTPRIWDALSRTDTQDFTNSPDGLGFVRALRSKGHTVVVSPQFSLPGPSLYSPFSSSQSHPIAFVDCHKYSKRGPFIHYKTTHTNRLLVERSGYSGWAEIQTHPERHNFHNVDSAEAKLFCDNARLEAFGESTARPEALEKYGQYAVIPLQIPGDSVQRLSPFKFYELIDNSIRFFKSKNLNIVLRRHPLCQDREVSEFLKSLPVGSGIFISDDSTRDLIKHSSAVALCNSSVGWDAILAHKPLICFGLAEYSRIAHQVTELSDLDEIETFPALLNKNLNDAFYYYFWQHYVVHGSQRMTKKICSLTDEIFQERLSHRLYD